MKVVESQFRNPWQGRTVFISGVCGTVGRELLRQVVELGPERVVGIDNNESELFFLTQEYVRFPNVRLSLGDLRDVHVLNSKMRDVDVVIHAAALKHVFLCEESPREAVQTNIVGVQNVIDAAQANKVCRVLFTSSDKAVNPTNVMGTSKLMGERLMTAANAHRRSSSDPIYASTRFGNVLGSRGSVIPLFRRQISQGGPVTLTDEGMTRFIMTLGDAVRLVMESVFLAKGGEVFVTKMPVIRIKDLASVMIQELAPRYGHSPKDIAIQIIGAKAGEKQYEELMNEEEVRRTIELPRYLVVLPAFRALYEEIDYRYTDAGDLAAKRPYNSSLVAPMERDDLRRYLSEDHLLEGS